VERSPEKYIKKIVTLKDVLFVADKGCNAIAKGTTKNLQDGQVYGRAKRKPLY
jgi:hypothetical protein